MQAIELAGTPHRACSLVRNWSFRHQSRERPGDRRAVTRSRTTAAYRQQSNSKQSTAYEMMRLRSVWSLLFKNREREIGWLLALSFLKELLDLRAVQLVTGVFSRSYHPTFQRRLLIIEAEPSLSQSTGNSDLSHLSLPRKPHVHLTTSPLLGTTHGVNVVGFRFNAGFAAQSLRQLEANN